MCPLSRMLADVAGGGAVEDREPLAFGAGAELAHPVRSAKHSITNRPVTRW